MKKLILISAAALFYSLIAVNPLTAWSQTETKQSMNSIYEKRIYAIKVGEMVETKRLFTTLGWPAYVEGKFDRNIVGFFISDTGDLRGCTEFCVNGLMAGNRRISRSGYDLKHKESSTQRSH